MAKNCVIKMKRGRRYTERKNKKTRSWEKWIGRGGKGKKKEAEKEKVSVLSFCLR